MFKFSDLFRVDFNYSNAMKLIIIQDMFKNLEFKKFKKICEKHDFVPFILLKNASRVYCYAHSKNKNYSVEYNKDFVFYNKSQDITKEVLKSDHFLHDFYEELELINLNNIYQSKVDYSLSPYSLATSLYDVTDDLDDEFNWYKQLKNVSKEKLRQVLNSKDFQKVKAFNKTI